MRIFATLLLLICAITTQAQPNSLTKPLNIGEIRTLPSKILNEDRILNIHLPAQYNPAQAYPVVYLLDGSINEDFLHLCGLFQFFNLQFKMPECIVVGIVNVDRKRDFTFHTDLLDLQKDFPTAGHSDAFIAFLAEELQPFIQKTYKTTETRYLIGQSLGGLLATEVLLKKPNLFSHYLMVSPSLWWDDESLLKVGKSLLDQQASMSQTVYISVGKGEAKIMQKEARALARLLKNSKHKNLQIKFNLMPHENHATILHRSIYEGLLWLFPYQE